jgi:hypothetical protein
MSSNRPELVVAVRVIWSKDSSFGWDASASAIGATAISTVIRTSCGARRR